MRNSSYSFIPILLKPHRCCDHALKICMWFGYDPQINFCHFVRNLNLAFFGHFHNESELAVGTLCAQLLLQFHANSFKTLHVLWAWSEDMHVVWILDYVLSFFSQFELSHFFGHFSEWIEGTLCAQLLLQFYTDTFETLQTL